MKKFFKTTNTRILFSVKIYLCKAWIKDEKKPANNCLAVFLVHSVNWTDRMKPWTTHKQSKKLCWTDCITTFTFIWQTWQVSTFDSWTKRNIQTERKKDELIVIIEIALIWFFYCSSHEVEWTCVVTQWD